MKTLVLGLTLTVLLLLPVPMRTPAQTDVPLVTMGMINGRFWLKCTYEQRSMWLIGYKNGIETAAAFTDAAEPENKLLAEAILGLQPPKKLSLTETVQAIDHFYLDTPENGPVVVGAAIRYVELKAGGAKQSELDDFAASLRRKNAAPEKKP